MPYFYEITTLPRDMLYHILLFLPTDEIVQLSLLSKAFKLIIRDNALWQLIIQRDLSPFVRCAPALLEGNLFTIYPALVSRLLQNQHTELLALTEVLDISKIQISKNLPWDNLINFQNNQQKSQISTFVQQGFSKGDRLDYNTWLTASVSDLISDKKKLFNSFLKIIKINHDLLNEINDSLTNHAQEWSEQQSQSLDLNAEFNLNISYPNCNFLQLHLTRLSAHSIQKLLQAHPKFNVLFMRNCHLKSWPVSLCSLSFVQVLDLSNNALQQVPSQITRLQNLTTLFLRNNLFQAFPLAILGLTKLIALDLSNDPFYTLSGVIPKNNHLAHMPPEIQLLTKLQSLALINVGLMVLPAEIGQLTNLKTLNVSQNRLDCLPPTLANIDVHVHAIGNPALDILPFSSTMKLLGRNHTQRFFQYLNHVSRYTIPKALQRCLVSYCNALC